MKLKFYLKKKPLEISRLRIKLREKKIFPLFGFKNKHVEL